MLASETAEKPRVKPSPESKTDALPPELLSDEAHRAAAERSAPWQVRHASRIRVAALVGISGALAGLALYGWNTLRPSELDKLQITLPARSPAVLVEPTRTVTAPIKVQSAPPAQSATVQPKVQTAVVPVKLQPAPAPQPRVEASASGRTPVTHTRGGATATAAAAAVPQKPRQAETNPNCAEGVAALGLCK